MTEANKGTIRVDYIQGVVEAWHRTKDLTLASDICQELYNLMHHSEDGAKVREIIIEVNDEAKI